MTSLCELEYSMWFDVLLPGVWFISGFLPLGGTTNHCKTEMVGAVGRWDAFNVTEDIELSAKMLQSGLSVGYFEGVTKEEAVISLRAWIVQRTRWIKGYIVTLVTYFDYFNSLGAGFLGSTGFNHLCFFGIFNPAILFVLICLSLADFCFGFNLGCVPAFRFACYAVAAFLAAFYILFCLFRVRMSLFFSVRAGALFVFYYVLQVVACFRAIKQVFGNQEYTWEKTDHGFCLIKDKQ